jgi:transcriptional regulator GlxA family with amidase domain
MASAVTGPLDLFAVTNTLTKLINAVPVPVRFDAVIVSAGGREVTAHSGIRFAGARPRGRLDVLIVPGIWHERARDLVDETARLQREMALIRSLYGRGTLIAAACVGTVLVAETGLLDGRTATTSWWLGEFFRRRYPAVRLALNELITQDNGIWCSGATTSFGNLCLQIVERFTNPDVGFMLTDPNRLSQAPYAIESLRPVANDSAIAKVQEWIHRNLGRTISLADMARVGAMSTRTLIRRFRTATGYTPLSYIQRTRMERAKTLLSTTTLAVQTVMDRTGYGDMSSFRKLFRAHTGLAPSAYRERFQIRARRGPASGNKGDNMRRERSIPPFGARQ